MSDADLSNRQSLAAHTGVIGSPSVNLFIDPLGGVRLISTHEQMFCPPYRVVGSSFPQSSVPPVPLTEAALAVGTACYNASKPLSPLQPALGVCTRGLPCNAHD